MFTDDIDIDSPPSPSTIVGLNSLAVVLQDFNWLILLVTNLLTEDFVIPALQGLAVTTHVVDAS